MKWDKGRQNTGYFKKKLAEWKFFDVYLLKFPVGVEVPVHRDPVKNKKHYRFNILLSGEDTFKCDNCIFRCGPIALFRSDKEQHSLDRVSKLTYILSIGLAL